MGNKKYSKELITVFSDSMVLYLDDYKKLTVIENKFNKTFKSNSKGYLEELVALSDAIVNQDGQPIPMWKLIQASEISFQVESNIQRN